MTIPDLSIQKIDGGTAVIRPSDTGVCAFIAPSESGTANQATQELKVDTVLTDFGGGALAEGFAYMTAVSGKPMLLVKGAGTTAGAYGTVTTTGGGSSVITGDGTSVPLDDYPAAGLRFLTGGTIGMSGITLQYTLDGLTWSATQALGTANSFTIPNSGVKFDFAAGTILANETVSVPCTGPINTNTDLVNALEALRKSSQPFEMILFHGNADATTVSDLDTWIKARQAEGRFYCAVVTARARHTDGSETEAQYLTYLQGIFASSSSLDVVVCADVGDVASPIPNRATTSVVLQRPVGWAVAARAMAIPLGRDAAYVNDGPVSQFAISDSRGNPNHHDEYVNPGLDALRLTTLRSWPGRAGAFITNANLLSPGGSDYVYLQHARVINRACTIAYQILSGELSRGVRKAPKAGPNGERYIAEGDALRIESIVNAAFSELAGQVDDIKFILSRTDDISTNAGATVHGSIQSVSLSYIKHFAVTAGYVKSISQ